MSMTETTSTSTTEDDDFVIIEETMGSTESTESDMNLSGCHGLNADILMVAALTLMVIVVSLVGI